jgi:hypothetical protein
MFRPVLVHLQGVYYFLLCKHLLNNIQICFVRGETGGILPCRLNICGEQRRYNIDWSSMWIYWRNSRYYCRSFEQGYKLYTLHSVQYNTVNTSITSTYSSNLFFVTFATLIQSTRKNPTSFSTYEADQNIV